MNDFADRLDSDPEHRARFVELLRATSSVLDGSSPSYAAVPEARAELATRLRAAARALCDHARIQDGHCLYCDTEVG